MLVSIESADGLKRSMRVEVPADQVQSEIDQRLRSVGKNAKLPGFRPGKVPPKVIRQRYGAQVRQEVLGDLLQSSYTQALKQEDLSPAGNPEIVADESNDSGGLVYTANFEVLPEVKLKDLDKIKIERAEVDIVDADVDEMIDNLRRQKGEWKAIERAAKKGDKVRVDFDGTLKGEPIPNGKGEGVEVELGAGNMLPDFEKALTGAKPGDELSFKVSYPKDYPHEDLAGKKADFSASVHEVQELDLPELDDELAKAYGVEEGGLEKLRADVADNMRKEAGQKIRAEVKEQALTALLDLNPLEIPKALVDRETHTMQHEAMQRMGVEDHSQAPPAEEFTEAADKRVKLGLLLHEFIQQESISIDEEKIRSRIADMFGGYNDPEQIIDTYMSNPQLRQQIEPMVLEEQAVERLVELGSETQNKVKFKDYMNPAA